MREYIADTNVYIMAANDEKFRLRFASFIRTNGPLIVSAVVAGELLIGIANRANHAYALKALSVGSEIVAPTADDWFVAGSALSQLGGSKVTRGRSFWNDALLAAQCARLGATLITSNQTYFRRLRSHTRVRAVAPFPQ